MSKFNKARGRYKPNPAFGGRKEKDGFLCSTLTRPCGGHWCVAVKVGSSRVQVRDTKDVSDKTLSFSRNEWKTFIAGVKKGEFDLAR